MRALVTEVETPGDPASQALRDRVRARHRELFTERATLRAQRAALDTAAPDVMDPTLLDGAGR